LRPSCRVVPSDSDGDIDVLVTNLNEPSSLLRNDVTGVSTTSSTAVSRNVWHTLELFGSINGTSSSISVWLDGSPVSQLTGTQSLGTNPIGYLQLGDTSTAPTSDVVFDDVKADPSMIQP